MAQDPFSFDFSISSRPEPQTARRYIAPPFDARIVSDREALVQTELRKGILKLPIDHVRLMAPCDRLRTLDEHVEHIAHELQLPSGQKPAIAPMVRQLADQGVLVSEDDLITTLKCQPGEQQQTGNIETLFVRTRARPETLGRLLESLIPIEPESAPARVVILDDDPDPESAAHTRQAVQEQSRRLSIPVYLVDRPGRTNLLQSIAAASGTEEKALQWLVGGDADDTLPSYGSGINTALLLAAGECFTIMDDDATLSAYCIGDQSSAVGIGPGHRPRLKFTDPNRPLEQQFRELETPVLGLHADHLGQGLNSLVTAGEHDTATLFRDVDPQIIHELTRGGRVRVTSNGTLGDPGTSGIQWLLTEPRENLAALYESEQAYERHLQQRQMARAVPHLQAATGFSLMTTTLTGIDNRDLLLPTQARGGNEDLLFGALVSYLHPGSLHVALPCMLFHMRPQPRQWRREDFRRPRGVNQGRFLTRQIEELATQAPGSDTGSRVDLLAQWLTNFAHQTPAQLAGRLQRELLETRGQMAERLLEARRQLAPPRWLAEDLEVALRAHAELRPEDEQQCEALVHRLPHFARHYARFLPDWQCAWQHCRETGIECWIEPNRVETAS